MAKRTTVWRVLGIMAQQTGRLGWEVRIFRNEDLRDQNRIQRRESNWAWTEIRPRGGGS